MHISHQIISLLTLTDWNISYDDSGMTAQKRLEGYAPSGMLSSGARNVTLTMDASGRWLARVDGWGKTIKDVDLRNFKDAAIAIETVLLG